MDLITRWKGNAELLAESSSEGNNVLKAYLSVLEHIHATNWHGACHASSGILASLLLTHGIKARPYIGECRTARGAFDHSWVEINGEIFDCAVSLPLDIRNAYPPTFRSKDLHNRSTLQVQYGISTGQGYGEDVKTILSISFSEYMSRMCPWNPEGFWGVASDLSAKIGNRIPTNTLINFAKDVVWSQRT